MRSLRAFLVLTSAAVILPAQTSTPDVGSGSPNETIRFYFQLAYYRNGFSNLVSLPPLGDVKRLGTSGLVQEFPDAAKTASVRYALIKPNLDTNVAEGNSAVLQMSPGLYSYYNTLGVNTVGYPMSDTLACPSLAGGNSCVYQILTNKYALFVYSQVVNQTTTNFSVRDPYYTRWNQAGGVGVLGAPNLVETVFTTSSGATGSVQTFTSGAIFNITGGNNLSPRMHIVKLPVWNIYLANNGYEGFMGAPTTEELVLPNGNRRQTFEGGYVEYDPRVPGSESLRLPVRSIVLAPQQGPVRLNAGETLAVSASLYGPGGETLTGRDTIWATTNARIASVQGNGATAVVRAVGGGQANITATSEGRTSPVLSIFVSAPCCAIGEGASTTALQQAFVDTATRNKLNPRLPAARPASRTGAGFVQEFQDAETGAPFLIAVSEKTLAGYVVRGSLLTAYLELGGPTGLLGYPASDPTAGGRQNFENGALAGRPVQIVSGGILAKWAVLAYETGLAGSPAGAPSPFLTFRATGGRQQAFERAVFYELSSGAQATKVFQVNGVVLAKYAEGGGAGGRMGAPLSDEYALDGMRRQDFEGGYIEYPPGGTEATAHEGPRSPVVTATPQIASAGTVVRLAAGGFDSDSRIRISITGKPDFEVVAVSGAYVWESYIPASSRTSQVTVRAMNLTTQASAQTVYTIRAAPEARVRWTIVRGDGQSAPPGALTPQTTLLRLADENGTPVPNVSVRVAASPGASIELAAPVTDERGEVQVLLRLPLSEGVALGTVEGAGQIATVSARSVRSSIASFPKFTQASEIPLGNGLDSIRRKGSLLVSVAAVLRHYQNRMDLPSPQGLADPLLLNNFLRTYCTLDLNGAQICDGFLEAPGSREQIVNLWRAGGFAGGAANVAAEAPNPDRIRDLLANGTPSIVSLSLGSGESHSVVATGVTGSGAIQIMDPSTAFNGQYLEDYLGGFTAGSRRLTGTITGVATLVAGSKTQPGFLVASNAEITADSPVGTCGRGFAMAVEGPDVFTMHHCDGVLELYQISMAKANGGAFSGTFSDLSSPGARLEFSGGGQASFRAARSGAQWAIAPMEIRFAARAVVNAADFSGNFAPGALVTVFGTGFDQGGVKAQVKVNDVEARVAAVSPFQVSVEIPRAIAPGEATLTVSSELGSASQPITLLRVAPAVFRVTGSRGFVQNADGSANSPYNPAARGRAVSVFATGLGETSGAGTNATTVIPVTVSLGGQIIPGAVARLAPGTIGVYQISLTLPDGVPPGRSVELLVRQQDTQSVPVEISVE